MLSQSSANAIDILNGECAAKDAVVSDKRILVEWVLTDLIQPNKVNQFIVAGKFI